MYKLGIKSILYFIALISSDVIAMNFLRPSDALYWRLWKAEPRFTVKLFAETGISHARAFVHDGCLNNPLNLYGCSQNGIAMLDGFPAGSPINNLRMELPVSSTDPINGQFLVNGKVHVKGAGAFSARFAWDDQFSVSCHLPFFSMKLDRVHWTDLTQNAIVKEDLTSNFFQNVCMLGDGLSLQGWRRTGVGDLVVLAHWMRSFEQQRPLLKQVTLNGRLGLNFPTGLRADEDKILAFPFGYDGAIGVIFAGGLDARLGYYIQVGFDVELLHLFGTTRDRRIKTDEGQTEWLLLAKTCAYKDYGFTQKFSLYVQCDQFISGASLLVGYQFFRHGRDDLWLETQTFSQEVANTSKKLQEWSMHQMLILGTYEAQSVSWRDHELVPSVSVYVRAPVDGKHSVLAPVAGVTVSVAF